MPNQGYIHPHPVPPRGAYHDRHERGTGSDGRGSCDRRSRRTRTAKACGPDVAVLASMLLELSGRYGGKRAVLRGEHAISRKAIAQGRPDALRWTCMLVCALFVHIAHETAGAARTRSSLRPLFGEGGKLFAKLGQNVPRDREHASTVIARHRVRSG